MVGWQDDPVCAVCGQGPAAGVTFVSGGTSLELHVCEGCSDEGPRPRVRTDIQVKLVSQLTGRSTDELEAAAAEEGIAISALCIRLLKAFRQPPKPPRITDPPHG